MALNRSDSIGEPLDIRAEMAGDTTRGMDHEQTSQIRLFSRAIASHRQGPPRCCSLRDEGKDEGVAVGIDKGNAEGLSGGFDYRLGCDQVEKLR